MGTFSIQHNGKGNSFKIEHFGTTFPDVNLIQLQRRRGYVDLLLSYNTCIGIAHLLLDKEALEAVLAEVGRVFPGINLYRQLY